MVLEKKEEVIKWLKEFPKLPTSRFVGLLGTDYDNVKRILDELAEEGLIIKEEETLAIYWKLNKEKEDEQEN